jgi:hypothetical protein
MSSQHSLYVWLFIGLALVCPKHVYSKDQSFEDRLPAEIKKSDDAFLTLTSENDNYGSGDDQDYTNGIRATYFKRGMRSPFLVNLADKYIPTFEVNETTSVHYSLGQSLYTPKNTQTAIPNPNDRPYAAFLYGSAGFATLSDNHIDSVELTLGVVGPAAFGEETQTFVHDVLDVDEPQGWDHQLENELGAIVSWQRQWPEVYATDIDAFWFRVMPHTGMTLGNIYTYGSAGLTLQLTPKQFQWQGQPQRVRPAMPGNGFFAVQDNKFAWSLFAGVEGRAIGRNIFLDGNSFENSPSVDKEYFVADANAGVSTTYGRTQISYTLNWRSREFEGQDDPSIFGVISIGRRF